MRFRGLVRIGAVFALVVAQGAAMAAPPVCACDPADMSTMPEMPMPASHHMPGAPMPAHQTPCSHPMAPAECATMAGCALTAVTSPFVTVRESAPVEPALRVAAAVRPASVARAPEPPPPRG